MSQSAYAFVHEVLPRRTPPEVRSSILGMYTMLAYGQVTGKDVLAYIEAKTQVMVKETAVYRSMHSNGELLHDVKQFAFMLLASQIGKYASQVPPGALKTPLPNRTQTEVANALLFKPLRRALTVHLQEGKIPLLLDEMDDRVEATLQGTDFKTYVRKFVYRKMEFIHRGAPTRVAEIESDLRHAALYNLLRTYPAWNDAGHMVAIAKIGARNRGHNFIKECTTKSRASLQTDAAGNCSAVNVSWDLVKFGLDVEHGSSDSFSCGMDGAIGSQEDYEKTFSLNQVLESKWLSPRKRHYLQLASGQFDSDFSVWLGVESNSLVASDLDFDEYIAKVQKYLRVPEQAGKELLREIRSQL